MLVLSPTLGWLAAYVVFDLPNANDYALVISEVVTMAKLIDLKL
jgi:hypothetical protein